MTVLTAPRHPLIRQALADARTWCTGQTIDERPALVHAVRVAVTLTRHLPGVSPELVAATLLHDAPEFAPRELDLDAVLTARYGREVSRVIHALQVEHHALDQHNPPIITHDRPVLLTSTADKIVALASLVRRARASGAPDAFFAARPSLLRLLPHFHEFHQAAAGLLPAGMADELGHVLHLLDQATATARTEMRMRGPHR
ncbi:HD domain-containing protein [Micromonospora craniellae]|uniref:HD domain-containing protein n=1 Tax=Micromonospora craniellae TaxID=2294034 RepID=A0A372FS69_9ACTN|nr:HD domain-containing protein [Micromonospora craniellae]QOC89666.1 HD domain-containing protein [Micromonospora craniellae]RFS43627.1 HD domain-containing protein [Micromonospora craniellae]